jgi:paraquat-inducible protein B
MKTFLSIFIMSAILLVACEEKPKETDVLYNKVMEVHDEIMPKMGDIMKLKKQLKEKLAELDTATEIDRAKIDDIERAIADLDNSHEEMMGWMRQFDRDFEGMVNEEILKYLNDQKGRIEKVGQVTNAALQNAQEQLAE